jgi:hypothetical protein
MRAARRVSAWRYVSPATSKTYRERIPDVEVDLALDRRRHRAASFNPW